ncbi:hypothetical protein LU290_06985 [Moraxella nasibovis]|uniref:hypothetical protein n=1 Tax=Moraxella nasibovis TaxID=2904120 RepID=UPI00240EB3CF|nr:hypothetical protein [Moraxella nasibovis]WFF38002.1 hypothetical protein LU290_06985 [Moraxella nasibovis]
MKKLITLLTVSALLTSPMAYAKGNKPCSGKKGGIASCTSGGKFMCKDGTISKSKKVCTKK